MAFLANVLVIDDEESMRAGCIQTLEENGYRVQAAENGRMGLEKTSKESFDVILLDLKMPGIGGMEVLKKLKENDPDCFVIVITAYGTIDSAVEAMKRGAYDFLSKPFTPEALNSIVKRAVDNRLRALEDACVTLALDQEMMSKTIVGQSDKIEKLVALVKKVAPTNSTILITGETGVGKELVAQTIHRLSNRAGKPFVTVDCGVLVESLFESEMFGHTKGSFTGAIETTQGKFVGYRGAFKIAADACLPKNGRSISTSNRVRFLLLHDGSAACLGETNGARNKGRTPRRDTEKVWH